VNRNGIVLGVIGKGDWDTDPTASAEQLMDPAPTTLRPSDSLERAKQSLTKANEALFLSPTQTENFWAPSSGRATMKSLFANGSCLSRRSGLDQDCDAVVSIDQTISKR
jgi:hypothetical protein